MTRQELLNDIETMLSKMDEEIRNQHAFVSDDFEAYMDSEIDDYEE